MLICRRSVPVRSGRAAPGRLAIGKMLLAPLVVGYRFGLVPGRVVRAVVVRVGFSGRREAEIREAGERFAQEVLSALVPPEALERIRWHRAQATRSWCRAGWNSISRPGAGSTPCC